MGHHIGKKKIIRGTAERPRLSVFSSLRGLYIQFINDDASNTIFGMSSLTKEGIKASSGKNNVASARQFGEFVGKKAAEAGIKKAVFDRNGRRYHGKIAALADGVRQAGIDF